MPLSAVDAAESTATSPIAQVAPAPGSHGAGATGQDSWSRFETRTDSISVVEEQRLVASKGSRSDYRLERANVRRLEHFFPGDPGALVILLLNHVSVRAGEALSLPAGTLHAYMGGLGIEVMAASDNVLRGGITSKHIDVDELVHVLRFAPMEPPLLASFEMPDGAQLFQPDVPDFRIVRLDTIGPSALPEGNRTIEIDRPTIALCLAGSASIEGARSAGVLRRGHAAYFRPGEGSLAVAGDFDIMFAAPGFD